MVPDLEHQSPRQEMKEDDETRAAASQRSCLSSAFRIIFKALLILVVVFYICFAVPVIVAAIVAAIVVAIVAVVVVALIPFVLMIVCSLPKSCFDVSSYGNPVGNGMYNQARCGPDFLDQILVSSGAIVSRASLGILMWLVLNVSVPMLKKLSVLGSPLWKWSLLGVTVTSSYFVAISLYGMPATLILMLHTRKPPRGYFSDGLMPSGSLVVYISIVLVSWVVYFGTESGLKHPSTPHPEAFRYVTWTFVSLLIGSILWLLKAFLLLKWSAGAIYGRFQQRILMAGVRYLYLGLIMEGFFERHIITPLDLEDHKSHESNNIGVAKYIISRKTEVSHLAYVGDILTHLAVIASSRDEEDGVSHMVAWFQQQIQDNTQDHDELNNVLNQVDLLTKETVASPNFIIRTPRFATDMMKGVLSLNDESHQNVQSEEGPANTSLMVKLLKEIVRRIRSTGLNDESDQGVLNLNDESDQGVLNLNDESHQKVQSEEGPANTSPMVKHLKELVGEDQLNPSAAQITFDDLKKWMVDAHKECVNMGRTLADANAIVSRLDIFLSLIILGATVLSWLLITGIATTTVLVAIATPLLALTFVFGDTAKAFFQGLIFCFATHAFDVGDRCLLDDTELEVKSMSILTTTFVKIGTKEKRLYPNSVLATKAIVNLGWQPDPSDVAEFTLDPSINIKKLKEEIVEYFGKNKSFYKGSPEVMFQEAGDKFTVLINFTHILTASDLTHSQCLTKKRKQRSEFVTEIKPYLINETRTTTTNDGNTTLASSTSPSVSAQHPISEISESNKHPELSK